MLSRSLVVGIRSIVLVIVVACSARLHAEPYRWTFQPGSTVTGSFVYDAATNTYSSVNLSAAGKTFTLLYPFGTAQNPRFLDGPIVNGTSYLFLGFYPITLADAATLLPYEGVTGTFSNLQCTPDYRTCSWAPLNQTVETGTVQRSDPPATCPETVSGIKPLLTPIGELFEDGVPAASLYPPYVNGGVDSAMFLAETNPNRGVYVDRDSGYRPIEYQDHLYSIRTSCTAYAAAIKSDPKLVDACALAKRAIDDEIKTHSPWGGFDTNGCPRVNRPSNSLHSVRLEFGGAQALDMVVSSQNKSFPKVASEAGLYTPCKSKKHYTLRGRPCDYTIQGMVKSPMNILLIDPLGRRVGFDPDSATPINEIGDDAYYSGPSSEPEFVDIHAPTPGKYRLIGIGTGTGSYELSLSRLEENAEVVEAETISGTTSPGQVVSIELSAPAFVNVDVRPGTMDNPVNVSAAGVIPVAVISSNEMLATRDIDIVSLRFGREGNGAPARSCSRDKDLDLDGLPDLLCHFETAATGLDNSDDRAWVTGQLRDGTPIRGNDWINVVPKRN